MGLQSSTLILMIEPSFRDKPVHQKRQIKNWQILPDKKFCFSFQIFEPNQELSAISGVWHCQDPKTVEYEAFSEDSVRERSQSMRWIKQRDWESSKRIQVRKQFGAFSSEIEFLFSKCQVDAGVEAFETQKWVCAGCTLMGWGYMLCWVI